MNKKVWWISGIVLIGLCAIDQISKSVALVLKGNVPLPSEALSAVSGSQLLLNISTPVSAVLCLFILFVMNLVIIKPLIGLKTSMAIFVAGLLSDSIDKTIRGGSLNELTVFSLNLTDIYIIVGFLSAIFFCIKDRSEIFHKNSLRKTMLIEKDQYKFCAYMLATYAIFSFSFGVFLYGFLEMAFSQTVNHIPPALKNQLVYAFLALFFCVLIGQLLLLIGFMVWLSNKIYGPVYAFKKYLNDILLSEQEIRPFNLRKGDHFNDLPELATKLRSKYRVTVDENKEK